MAVTGTGQSGRTVLVIDEDPQIGRLVRSALLGRNYSVITSTRAEEGLLLAARHKPTLVLMEARFRNTDGVDLAGKILRAPGTSNSAVSIITDGDSFSLRFRAFQLGVSDFLRKPVAAPVLRQRVDALCRVARSGPPRPQLSPSAHRLADLLRRIEETLASGTLHLEGARGPASLAFTTGGLHAAQLGSLTGLHAFDAIARAGDWAFNYDGDPLGPDPSPPLDDLAPLPSLDEEPTGPEISADEHTILDPALELRFMQSERLSFGAAERALGSPQTSEEPTDPQFQSHSSTLDALNDSANTRPGPDALLRSGPLAAVTGPIRGIEASGGERARAALGSNGAAPITEPILPAELQKKPDATGEEVRSQISDWIKSARPGPLLVALSAESVRAAVRDAAEGNGFATICTSSAAEAYQTARQRHPCAMLADTAFPDADGRALLAAIRSDYSTRELTVILFSSAAMSGLLEGSSPLHPILSGLDRALAAHARLWEQLFNPTEPLQGAVEPVGIGNLLRMLGAQRFSGRLEILSGDVRNAEVVFDDGHPCGVVVNAPQSSVGPLAMLNLVGYEWSRFSVLPGEIGARIPLGDLRAMINSACRQNNALMRRVFEEGLKAPDIAVDRASLDSYLRAVPAASLATLLRLAEGEPAAEIAKTDQVSPPALRALLFDMRRKGVIRVHSLKTLRVDETERTGARRTVPVKQPRRWLVVALSTLATVALASAGYFAYRHLHGGEPRQVSPPASRPVQTKP